MPVAFVDIPFDSVVQPELLTSATLHLTVVEFHRVVIIWLLSCHCRKMSRSFRFLNMLGKPFFVAASACIRLPSWRRLEVSALQYFPTFQLFRPFLLPTHLRLDSLVLLHCRRAKSIVCNNVVKISRRLLIFAIVELCDASKVICRDGWV